MQSFPKAKFSSLHMLGEPFAWHHWTRGAAQLCIQPPWGFTRRLGWSNLLILWILELWFSKSIIMWLSVPQERSKRQFHDRDFGKHLSSTHQTMTSSWGLSASTSLCIFCVAHCCETLFLPDFLHLIWALHRETYIEVCNVSVTAMQKKVLVCNIATHGCARVVLCFCRSGWRNKDQTEHEQWTFWNTIAVLASCTLPAHSKFWFDSRRQA